MSAGNVLSEAETTTLVGWMFPIRDEVAVMVTYCRHGNAALVLVCMVIVLVGQLCTVTETNMEIIDISNAGFRLACRSPLCCYAV